MARKQELPVLYKATANGSTQSWRTWVEEVDGIGVIHTEYGLVGGAMQHTRDEIREGKNLGRANETTPIEQARLEAHAAWQKKLDRKHYGTDAAASESLAKRCVAPMLAKSYEDHKSKVLWDSAYVQPKLDGFRMLADKIDGQVIFWSREGKNFQLDHIAEVLSRVMKNGDRLDGEIYQHGVSLNKIASLVKRPQEGTEQLVYHVYDAPVPLPFSERFDLVKSRLRATPACVVPVPTFRTSTEDGLMALQAEFLGAGMEGAMLRWGALTYQAGKRADCLLKVKTFVDAEFPIVNVTEGRGTYKGCAIFTCLTSAGHEFDCTAPGTLEEKRQFWASRDKWPGQLLTVKFAGFTKTEAPVPWHPVALRVAEKL